MFIIKPDKHKLRVHRSRYSCRRLLVNLYKLIDVNLKIDLDSLRTRVQLELIIFCHQLCICYRSSEMSRLHCLLKFVYTILVRGRHDAKADAEDDRRESYSNDRRRL